MSRMPCFNSSKAARKERTSVDRRLNPARATVKKPYAQGMLEIGNDLRYGRMRDTQLSSGLAEAARLHNREEDPQVAQPQSTSDVVVPIGYLSHKRALSTVQLK